ncbi:MAG TPA: UDP-2,3-diacylglucosamine diphosphatase [Burkholderiales bacterium]
MGALLVSDLHLTESRPQANEAFFSLLESEAREAGALYILGDLFEYWIGDDDLADPFNAIIAGALKNLSALGVRLYVMQGNRDFLMGPAFCAATGAALLPDPTVHTLGGQPTLLMHGDTLCTDDVDYQAWRRTARSSAWQEPFLAKPLKARRREIEALRDKSREVIQAKPAAIMDVNEAAVKDAFREHGVSRLVHGHTHRPGRHALQVDGKTCERWVLPDWYGKGGYLEFGEGPPRLVRFQ